MQKMGFDNLAFASADIDEKKIRDEDPKTLTLKIAEAKNDEILSKIFEDAILITFDQVIVCNGVIREKPYDEDEAREFIKSYAQYPAYSYEAVVVTNTKTGKRVSNVDVSWVQFAPLSDQEIDELIKKGDVLNAAGGFTIEDQIFLNKIININGSIESISGLPEKMVQELITEVQK